MISQPDFASVCLNTYVPRGSTDPGPCCGAWIGTVACFAESSARASVLFRLLAKRNAPAKNNPHLVSFIFVFLRDPDSAAFDPCLPYPNPCISFPKSPRNSPGPSPSRYYLAAWTKFNHDVFLNCNRRPINVRGLVAPLAHRAHRRRDQVGRPADRLHIYHQTVCSDRRAQMNAAALALFQRLRRITRIDLHHPVSQMHSLQRMLRFRPRLSRHKQKLMRTHHD